MLRAALEDGVLVVSLLAKKKARSPFSLVHVTGPIADPDKENAAEFAEAIMGAAYLGHLSRSCHSYIV